MTIAITPEFQYSYHSLYVDLYFLESCLSEGFLFSVFQQIWSSSMVLYFFSFEKIHILFSKLIFIVFSLLTMKTQLRFPVKFRFFVFLKCNKEPLEDFKYGSNIIWFVLKRSLWLLCHGCRRAGVKARTSKRLFQKSRWKMLAWMNCVRGWIWRKVNGFKMFWK